ncbi:MAG: trigger factor [Syntrophobacterales bacterium]|nr:trigger factor [Syntrophobacterales bacterium]
MTPIPIQVEVETLSPIKRKLAIVVPKEEVAQAVDRAYRDLGKRAKVKGFRPGRVPRAVLEMYYRKQVEQEVSDDLVRRSLGEALQEQALIPLNFHWPEPVPPVVPGEDYRFVVELEVPPEFELADYRGLTLTDPGAEVTEEMVDARLREIQEHNTTLQPVAEPRPVQEGDFVILDYQAYFAGEELPEGKGENIYLEVGAGKFNPEFEQHLIGLLPGGETRFSVELPPDFFHPLLAGKVIEFAVKLHEIKEQVVPELDDAFAQSLGGNFQTLADLREAVRSDIIKKKERERQAHLEQQVLEQLAAAHPFEVPPSLVRREQEAMHREQLARLQSYGVKVEGLDHPRMLETLAPKAEFRVKSRLILDRIAQAEKVEVSEAEVEETLARYAEALGRPVEEVRQYYRQNNLLEPLRQQLRDEKIMKLIIGQAELHSEAPAAPKE